MNTVSYVVKSPIHGYNGMGYEHTSLLERSFGNESAARKHLDRCNKAHDIYMRSIPESEDEEEFMREMSEEMSFHFRGYSHLVRRTVTDELLN